MLAIGVRIRILCDGLWLYSIFSVLITPSRSEYLHRADDVCYNKEECEFASKIQRFDAPFSHHSNSAIHQSDLLQPEIAHVVIVACGDRQPEAAIAVKAIISTAVDKVYLHIFTEDDLMRKFYLEFKSWSLESDSRFMYRFYPITFPQQKFTQWKSLFKTCASQRLFIPNLLVDVDSVLYIDTDVLLLRPVQDIWTHFKSFNTSQLAAAAPEHESASAGWYNRFARHPYYGKLGINSGVMLMNLTRIRSFGWLEKLDEYLETFKWNITWGDQDLLNILFHYYPELLYVYDCSWNYRPDHCMYMSVCKDAEVSGINVLHGNRGTLHNDQQPAFNVVFDAFKKYKFDGIEKLVGKIEQALLRLKYEDGRCQAVKDIFVKQLKSHIKPSRISS